MHAVTKSLRVLVLGTALLTASGPAIDSLGMLGAPINAAHAFKKLGGADKIGWARKFRAWCKQNGGHPQCGYVNSLASAKCVRTDIRNLKGACRP